MQKLKGYTLAYILLLAIYDALDTMSEITIREGFPLADEYWHMGDYVKNIKGKVRDNLGEEIAPHCFKLMSIMKLPKRICSSPLKGRTEYTPRANPSKTSIRSILDKSQVPKNLPTALYDGENVKTPFAIVPEYELDPLEIIGLEGKLRRKLPTSDSAIGNAEDEVITDNSRDHRRKLATVEMGSGWQLSPTSFGDSCDGIISSSSTCGRLKSNDCLLEGHQGARGGMLGNETTGWLVMYLNDNVENGFIGLNIEIGSRGSLESLPDTFLLDFAINNHIYSLDKPKFIDALQQPVPGVQFLVLLDDAEQIGADNAVVAIRISGCPAEEKMCQLSITHVYWS